MVESDRPHMITWRKRIAYWIPKATNTPSECVILDCISTVTEVMRTRLSVRLYLTLLVLLQDLGLSFVSVGMWPSSSALAIRHPRR